MIDIILVKKARDGCNDSFEQLIKASGSKIYKIAFSYVKNETSALDVVSEATYKAYINIDKLKDEKSFDAWLMKIVINEALISLKKQKKIIHLDDYKKEIAVKVDDNVDNKVDLQNALDMLKKDEKEILILKYFGDLTFSEISKTIKKSENTIKTKHYRALEKVKRILQGG